MDRGFPVYILCKEKQGRQTKTFEIRLLWDCSMAGAWRENRSDKTCIKKLQILVCQTLQRKTQSIGKYSSMIVEQFDTLGCQFGAWMPDYERGQQVYLIWLEDNFQSVANELEYLQVRSY